MRRDRKFDVDRLPAFAVALGLHALVATWWLHVPPPAPATDAGEALQVVWVERPPPAKQAQAPSIASQPAAVPATPVARAIAPRPRRPDAPAPAAAKPVEVAPAPTAAALLAQGAALAREGARHDFHRNPLVDRPPSRIEAPGERIRMRDPLTPARVMAAVGQLFGGSGYETDPCPRIIRNLGALRTAGADDPALQEELRRHRRFCQG